MDNTIEQQRAIYGMSLAERFGSVMKDYDLSQRALAKVLGISAPMLSQLIGARRIKIGNPAVYGRLLMLESRAGEAERGKVLAEVESSDPVTATQSAVRSPEANDRNLAAEYLRTMAEPAVLRQLAGDAMQLGAAGLAALLEEAAGPAV